jgi:hypothetical protein
VQAITEFRAGKVEYRTDKTGIVHIPFGKTNFTEEDLLTNLIAVAVILSNFDILYFNDGFLHNIHAWSIIFHVCST